MDKPLFPTREMPEEEAIAERARLEKEIAAAFKKNDFPGAEKRLRELIPLDHENFVPWYNLACALSMQGGKEKIEDALDMLKQSIARGFADLRGMRSDPHLANLRATEEYKAIEAAWGSILDRRTERTIENAKKKFKVGEKGSPYILDRDESKHLIYISAFDPALFAEAKKDADKLERWWKWMAGEQSGRDGERKSGSEETQAPHSSSPHSSSDPQSAPSLTPWVLVILPTRKDYIAWAMQRYGDRYDRVGGEYNHDSKTLVSMDLGSSWRHEFWHIMHWRDMDNRGQRHPMWVMEGLCSLVEDCDTGPNGEMQPRASWRTNMVARLGRSGRLIPFDVIFDTNHKGFMGERTLAYYGQSRAMFLFLAERGHLQEWYRTYTGTGKGGFKEDPSGRAAFEVVLGKPIKDVERDFRKWVATLPEVAEEPGRGPANLPVDVGIGSGAGPVVKIDNMAELMTPGVKQTNTQGLRDKDVITAIDAKPVRDLNDLARVLGEYEAGATVTVAYIRGKVHGELKVKLVPPR
jgi:hypothetical protein